MHHKFRECFLHVNVHKLIPYKENTLALLPTKKHSADRRRLQVGYNIFRRARHGGRAA